MKINTYAVNCNDAWLNSEGDDISGSYVKYKDHQEVVAALEARCAALAADNGILLAIMNEQAGSFGAALAEGFHDAVMESGSDQLIDIYQRRLQPAIQCIPPTPDTDAFLAEVRASGVEMLADHLSGMNISASETSVRDFATQIRKGVQS
ncbi:hypothetical protein HCN11_02985 [Enterobacter kobei]|uniref:hypothetical protein n=1 Tax=Enterobacter kobei TaxID=208224 RepID=UPI00168A65F7|nr:hypothetical protein [Enterobacter kobei]ELE9731651.1 hypothetical protein [Enterobacter kobei]ELF1032803.1 hypothetical protein [Enterobacter kobei]MBD3598951.1 hypothetical protein [Enterobacter kobei]